jgi:RluA family pseudouridine synthase
MRVLWSDGEIEVLEKRSGVTMEEVYKEVGKGIGDIKKERDIEFVRRSGVAHRLDKETSGCLLVGKNAKVLEYLMNQFRERKVKKEYLALVHGRMEPKEGEVCLPLRRSKSSRLKREVGYDGKMAQTSWRVEQYYSNYSLVRLWPLTGRMHQIRVHLAHLGYPIFADSKYLNSRQMEVDREKLKRHFLHAQVIGFFDMKGEWIRVVADLDKELREVLSMLE